MGAGAPRFSWREPIAHLPRRFSTGPYKPPSDVRSTTLLHTLRCITLSTLHKRRNDLNGSEPGANEAWRCVRLIFTHRSRRERIGVAPNAQATAPTPTSLTKGSDGRGRRPKEHHGQAARPPFSEDFDPFEDTSKEVTVGYKWELRKKGILKIGAIENISSFDNSPDFGVHVGFSQRF